MVTVPFSFFPNQIQFQCTSLYICWCALVIWTQYYTCIADEKKKKMCFHFPSSVQHFRTFYFSVECCFCQIIFMHKMLNVIQHTHYKLRTEHRAQNTHAYWKEFFFSLFIPFNCGIKWWNIIPSNRHGSSFFVLETLGKRS